MKSLKYASGYSAFVFLAAFAITLVGVSAQLGSGLLSFTGIAEAQAKTQGKNGNSYGYQNPGPEAYLYYTGAASFSNAIGKWSYQIGYAAQNVKSGSIKVGNTLLANNINNQSAIFYTPYILNPNTSYTFKFYQEKNGNGPVLSSLTFTTLPVYGYGH